eukprot:m.380764 g.380764  ORF g.380764 m.380764 type:complete len:52 (+) comp20039_c1_seq1:424-579(+)
MAVTWFQRAVVVGHGCSSSSCAFGLVMVPFSVLWCLPFEDAMSWVGVCASY